MRIIANSNTADYRRGQKLAAEISELHIAINGVWSARLKEGGIIHSYETIGYHKGSVEFLKGVRDAGVRIVNHYHKSTFREVQ